MIWQDKGYLISQIKYNENSVISEFFTEMHGKVSGIIFGASSKKLKNYLLIGNKFHLNFNSKNDDKLGYFKIEIEKANTPFFLDNKTKLSCLIYAMSLLKVLTAENQENKNIFYLINDFFTLLDSENWVKDFIFWELNILKNLGYDINFKNYVSRENINGIQSYMVNSNNMKRIVPNYLIDKNKKPKNFKELFDGLNLVGDFLDKTIIKPNNLNFPNSRIDFVNLLK